LKIINYTHDDIASMKVIHRGDYSVILDNGKELVKIITYFDYTEEVAREVSQAKTIVASEYQDLADSIALPTAMVYIDGQYVGHTLTKRFGTPFPEYYQGISNINLKKFAQIFSAKEKVIKKVHEKEIVVPDLATESNILIEESQELKIHLLDYDGFQIKHLPTFSIANQINYSMLLKISNYMTI